MTGVTDATDATDAGSGWPCRMYVINLARRADRWAQITAELARVQVNVPSPWVQRIDAVDAQRVSHTTWKQSVHPLAWKRLQQKNPRLTHEELGSWGACGCYLSHVEAWQQVQRSQVPGLVLEDDMCWTPTTTLREQVCGALHRLHDAQPAVDLALLGAFVRDRAALDFVDVVGGSRPWVRYRGRFFGTHAYWLSPQGASVLLRHALPMTQQVDSYMSDAVRTGKLHTYLAVPDLAHQQGMLGTDIQVQCDHCLPGDAPYRAELHPERPLAVLSATTAAVPSRRARLPSSGGFLALALALALVLFLGLGLFWRWRARRPPIA